MQLALAIVYKLALVGALLFCAFNSSPWWALFFALLLL